MDSLEIRRTFDWLGEHADRVLREGSYGLPGQEIYYEDKQTQADLRDLYSVLDEQTSTGSSNLENSQVRGMIEDTEYGRPLSDVQIGRLKELMAKYAAQIGRLRASPDKHGQDFMHVPDPGTARLINGGS